MHHRGIACDGSRRAARGSRGAVIVFAALILTALLACVGFALDGGHLYVAVQQCQNIADSAALGGAQELPYANLVRSRVAAYAEANMPDGHTDEFQVTSAVYQTNQTIPGLGVAPYPGAVAVTVRKTVQYHFLQVVGLQGVTVQRRAVATKNVGGSCIAPMWISNATQVQYGVQVNMLMADGPHYPDIPGSFGFLRPNGNLDFEDCLKGLITAEEAELQRVYVGDYVWAKTGLNTGQWRGALKTDSDSRLARASRPPYNSDTFTDFHPDNPRIMIVPFVTYVAGQGANAYFLVRRFGAFWLEDVITQGNDKRIIGRFLDFTNPGGTGYNSKDVRLIG